MDKNQDEQIQALPHLLPTRPGYPLISLDHNPDLSEVEYLKACEIARVIKDNILRLEGADLSPISESWKMIGGSTIYSAAIQRRLLRPEYETINHLRLHTAHFTGYRLANVIDDQKIPGWTDTLDGEFNLDLAPGAPDWSIPAFLEMIKNLPDDLVCRPPLKLGEVGWFVKGGVVNRDVLAYQERVAALYESGILDELRQRREVHIIEIGGGYGGLAYYLKKIMPQAQYYLCDLPLSLLFSSVYLSLVNPFEDHLIYTGQNKEKLLEPRAGVSFIPSFLFDDLAEIKFDLAINTLSFAEMPNTTVRHYVSGLASMLGESGFLFEQNFGNRHYALPSFCNPEEEIQAFFKQKRFARRGGWGTAQVWKAPPNSYSVPDPGSSQTASAEGKQLLDQAGPGSPELVERNYCGFNLVAYRRKIYGFALSLGLLEIGHLDARTLGAYQQKGDCFIGASVEAVKQLLDQAGPGSPELMERNYSGFNLIAYRGKIYGFALSLGLLDIGHLDTTTLEIYQQKGECFIGASVEAVKQLIDQAGPGSPELVERNYSGFNLVTYRRKIYGLARSLGPVGLTSLDPHTLQAYQANGQCFVGASLEEVKQTIAARAAVDAPNANYPTANEA